MTLIIAQVVVIIAFYIHKLTQYAQGGQGLEGETLMTLRNASSQVHVYS